MNKLMNGQHTTWSLLCNSNRYIFLTSLSSQMTLAQFLYTIGCANRPWNIRTGRTNTLCFVVHYLAADIVWSTAALSDTWI